MILDSSAVVSVLLREPGFEAVSDEVERESALGVGAPTLAETGIVLRAKLGVGGRTLLARFLDEADVVVIPFEHAHWPIAVEAFSRFGKGRHPAGLNLGDCLTYATARLADEPLLCFGDDFPKTDLALVL